MASPGTITIRNLTGQFTMNKTLSNDPDALLALQGIGWWTRKAISLATVLLTVSEYSKDDVLHIDITSNASGLSTTQENRTLNWTEAEHNDKIFGKVTGKSRLFLSKDFQMEGSGSDFDATFLKAEVLKDGTASKFLDDEHVQSWAKSEGGGWTAEQVWGFEEIAGTRYYTRRVVVLKGEEVQRVRLVYDYKGKNEDKSMGKGGQVVEEDDGLAYGEDNQ